MKNEQHHLASETKAKAAESTMNPHEVERTGTGLSRRTLLKSLTCAAASALLPPALKTAAAHPWKGPAETQGVSGSPPPTKNPAWYGFNLLEYFSTDPDWMKYFPYKNDGMFLEDDFRWMRDWGFNFVRLPMDYRFWTDPNDLMKINEKKVDPIDRAIRLGEKWGIHVNICLHRAPGECILDGLAKWVTGIHITEEKTSVYDDPHTVEAFVHQWAYFAQRYRGIPNERLSFNLVNEPSVRLTLAEMTDLALHKPNDALSRKINEWPHRYVRVVRSAIDGIRAHESQRWIVTDGYQTGVAPIPDLIDTGILQSGHTYHPTQLTHYKCEWAWKSSDMPVPTWPLKDSDGHIIDRAALAALFRPWRDLTQRGVRIHFGEVGCYKYTPPQVMLAWFNDTLDVIGELGSGWALWNFRGPVGILDTERPGTKYEDWHGHQLDRPLLNLLRKKTKA